MKTRSFSATRVALRAAGIASVLLVASAAGAQTITLAQSNATTLRGGSYASTNYSDEKVLETRASSDASYVRRALMKFDTHTTIPAGSTISSARLTITVAGGNSQSRTLAAYGVTSSYDELVATWNSRKSSTTLVEGRRRHQQAVRNRDGDQQGRLEGHLRRHRPRAGCRSRRLRHQVHTYRPHRRGKLQPGFVQADSLRRCDDDVESSDADRDPGLELEPKRRPRARPPDHRCACCSTTRITAATGPTAATTRTGWPTGS